MLGNASETGIALRAIDASEAPSGLKQASPAVASPSSPVGFPVSNAPQKFALWAKDTERDRGLVALAHNPIAEIYSRLNIAAFSPLPNNFPFPPPSNHRPPSASTTRKKKIVQILPNAIVTFMRRKASRRLSDLLILGFYMTLKFLYIWCCR